MTEGRAARRYTLCVCTRRDDPLAGTYQRKPGEAILRLFYYFAQDFFLVFFRAPPRQAYDGMSTQYMQFVSDNMEGWG